MSDTILTAIIAGSVSLIISGFSGVYVYFQNKNKLDQFKQELIIKAETEHFLTSRTSYSNNYTELQTSINNSIDSSQDNTKTLQLLINFHATHANDYYLRNKTFLKTSKLEKTLVKINSLIESKTLENNSNQEQRLKFWKLLVMFFKKLNEASLS